LTESVSPTKTIDVKGLFCPEPVFRTKIEIERIGIGEVLKVMADDPEAEEDISRWVTRNGHELVNFTKENNELIFLIKKAK
jgi:TusA-related sulfurtransferase